MASDCTPSDDIYHDDKDCWTGVQDPKQRKKIQDRLAQRARRRRLAEAKKGRNKSTPASPEDGTIRASDDLKIQRQSPTNVVGIWRADNSECMSLMPIPINIYSALWNNGDLLGLKCTDGLAAILSERRGPEIPASLHPTEMQLSYVHPPWIDRFPFPKMRDNFIALLGLIDTEDFLYDLFNGPSFSLTPGGASWDPTAWTVEANWKKKWGFLFEQDLSSGVRA